MQKQTEIKFKNEKKDNQINNYFKAQQEIFDFMYSKLNDSDKLHVIELNKKQVTYLS